MSFVDVRHKTRYNNKRLSFGADTMDVETYQLISLHFVLSAFCCAILLVEIIKLWDLSNSNTTPWRILVTLGVLFGIIAYGIDDRSIALGMWFGVVGCGVALVRCNYYIRQDGAPPHAKNIDGNQGCPTSGTYFDQKKWQGKNIASFPINRSHAQPPPKKNIKPVSREVVSLEEFKKKKK